MDSFLLNSHFHEKKTLIFFCKKIRQIELRSARTALLEFKQTLTNFFTFREIPVQNLLRHLVFMQHLHWRRCYCSS